MSNSRLCRWCWKYFNFGSLLFKGRTRFDDCLSIEIWIFASCTLNPNKSIWNDSFFMFISWLNERPHRIPNFMWIMFQFPLIVSNADTIATVQSEYKLYRNENSLFLASSGLSYLCWITITMPKVHFQSGPVHLLFQTDSDDIQLFNWICMENETAVFVPFICFWYLMTLGRLLLRKASIEHLFGRDMQKEQQQSRNRIRIKTLLTLKSH